MKPTLWQFNLATFIGTQILLGVEGWLIWAVSALIAWGIDRGQADGAKNYLPALVIWTAMMWAMWGAG